MLAAALAAPGLAQAFFNDRVELFFSENATWDSNVFRLPDGASPQATVGESSFRDRILVHSAGVNADVPWSLQRFQASYQHFWTRYQKFDQLDFDGRIWRLAWLWSITPEHTGDVGVSETTGLASFATFRGTTQDVIRTRQAFASGNWAITPRWTAYGGLTATERKHDDTTRRANDIEASSVELKLTYATPKENRIGVSARYEDGGAPQTTIFRGVPFDNEYEQYSIGVVGRWDVTVKSRIDGRVDYLKRDYAQFSERDYTGPAWGVTYTWTPTPKFSVATTVRRDIAPLDDVQTTFVVSTAGSIQPRWAVTEKVTLFASADYARWKYRGDPTVAGEFEHRIRSGSVGFTWAPYRKVLVSGSFQREVRKSDLAAAEYEVDIATLDARIGF